MGNKIVSVFILLLVISSCQGQKNNGENVVAQNWFNVATWREFIDTKEVNNQALLDSLIVFSEVFGEMARTIIDSSVGLSKNGELLGANASVGSLSIDLQSFYQEVNFKLDEFGMYPELHNELKHVVTAAFFSEHGHLSYNKLSDLTIEDAAMGLLMYENYIYFISVKYLLAP